MEREGDAVSVAHEATRWDELFPRFTLRLEIASDGSSARLIYEEDPEEAPTIVIGWLEEAGTRGLLRQEIVKRLEAARLAKGKEAAEKMATRILQRLRTAKLVEDSQEGNAKRYWLAKHVQGAI